MLGPAPWHEELDESALLSHLPTKMRGSRLCDPSILAKFGSRVSGDFATVGRSAMRGYTGCPVGDAQNLGFATRIALNQYGESTLHRGIVRIVGTFRICCVKALIADRHKFCVPLGTTIAKNCDGTHIQFLTQLDNAGREVHRLQTEAKQ